MSARPIVLLHGAGESGCYFDPLRGELARAFSGADFRVEGSEAGASALARPRSPRGRVARDLPNGFVPISYGYLEILTPSLPGRGDDHQAPPLQSVLAMAAWCESLCEARNLARPILVGHSLGGAVAIEVALRRRLALGALVLVSTGAKLRVNRHLLESARGAVASGHLNPFGDPSVPAASALTDWLAANDFDRLRDVARIDVPTHVAVGADDLLTPPRYAQFLAEQIPGATLRVFEGAAHDLLREAPAALAKWLAEAVGEKATI